MLKKTFTVLFLSVICLTVSFAQNANQQNITQWEYLEVSNINISRGQDGQSYYSRNYSYLNSSFYLQGDQSLDWLGKAGWELVGVTSSEGGAALYFKRIYNKERTEKEIKDLKEREKNIFKIEPSQSNSNLVDLDIGESKQNLADFNRSEEEKLRNALEQIKDLPIKIVDVKSNSFTAGQTSAVAELVIDATKVLLKDGNKYRSSEADKYFQEVLMKIKENMLITNFNFSQNGYAKAISTGKVKPQNIGAIPNYYNSGITLKISLIVNYNGQQNIVAQGYVSNLQWNKNTKQTD